LIISLIAAVDDKGGIGKNNRLPWHLPSDLKRFKQLTMGHHILMGRKTYESISKALPGRIMLVVSHSQYKLTKDVVYQNSVTAAIAYAEANGENELFIIGGSEIFEQVIDIADRIYLTLVHTDSSADVFFPRITNAEWQAITTLNAARHNGDELVTEFKILQRKY
jgi:dihydrofolate reductase